MRIQLILLAALFFASCKGPCRQLAERLCDCEPNTPSKESCLQRVQVSASLHEPTAEDEQTCEALLPRCQCRQLDSEDPAERAEAKKACGMARE